jgi:hypothetical protein
MISKKKELCTCELQAKADDLFLEHYFYFEELKDNLWSNLGCLLHIFKRLREVYHTLRKTVFVAIDRIQKASRKNLPAIVSWT